MKILLIGPLPPPITGNSIINSCIIDSFEKHHKDIKMDAINIGVPNFDNNFGQLNFTKLLLYIGQYKSIYKVFFTEVTYISIGHTFFGILKYFPFFLLSKILRKKIIVHVHTDYLWTLYNESSTFKKHIIKTILSLTDKGIVLSPLLRRNLQAFISEQHIYELPNFISETLLNHNINNTIVKKRKAPIKILFLSNLIKSKGIIDFLEAMVILEKKDLNFEIHVAGDIPIFMKEEVNLYFEKLKNIIHYHGVVKGNQKHALYLASNIFVFPTHQEAQGIVLLEAMATANIILTTNVGGIPDIISENINGYTIEVKNPQNIVESILKIFDKINLHEDMLKKNYYEVKEKYTEKKFFDNLYKIIMD